MPRAALLLVLLLPPLARLAARGLQDVATSVTLPEDIDSDDDSDSVPFMVVVEHADEFRCSGSLLSERTAISTELCALGQRTWRDGERYELWVFASTLLTARPPAPLAAAARRVRRVALAAATPSALNLAVLELERPFDAVAAVRPIMLATSQRVCEHEQECYTVHALAARQRRRVRLAVINVTRTENSRCASRMAFWPTSSRELVCYTGEELCENDMGEGVVCNGWLCAVVGDVTAAEEAASGAAARCGGTYVSLAVAYWRRFLQCAHMRHCGRDDCENLCTERRLLPDDDAINDTRVDEISVSPVNEQIVVTGSRLETSTTPLVITTRSATRTRWAAAATPAAHEDTEFVPPVGRFAAFEPNRADFKVTPSRTTLVRLKAGEYGDNAAEYEGDEPPAQSSPSGAAHSSVSTGAVPPPRTDKHGPPDVERQVSPPARSNGARIKSWCLFIISVILFTV